MTTAKTPVKGPPPKQVGLVSHLSLGEWLSLPVTFIGVTLNLLISYYVKNEYGWVLIFNLLLFALGANVGYLLAIFQSRKATSTKEVTPVSGERYILTSEEQDRRRKEILEYDFDD